MNRIATSLAIVSAAFATHFASAAGFAGNFVSAAPVRVVNGCTQNVSISLLPSTPVRVTLCSGAVQLPVFVVTGPTTAVATGTSYTIKATIISATKTRFDITCAAGATVGIARVVIGGGSQPLLFDRTNPNPGTIGSLTGQDVNYISGIGPWIMRATWSNPIQRGTAPVANDVYNTLSLDFSVCFGAGNAVAFDVDTDSIG